MKKLLLFLLPLSLILTSCGADPVKYNDALVDYHDIANKRVTTLYEMVAEDMSDGDFSKLKEYSTATADSLKSDLAKINGLKKPSGADEFHNAMTAYVESLISYVDAIGEQYSQVNDSTTDEEFDKFDKIVDGISDISDQKSNDMIKAQKAFAKAKNFELR